MAQIAEPVWIEAELALAIHDRQLAEHGGPIGVRDASAMESALGRPRNQWAYGEPIFALWLAYAYGVARNHPFVDGNKRTAWVLARLFLLLTMCGSASRRRRPFAWLLRWPAVH
jgi:death-on-curing protein